MSLQSLVHNMMQACDTGLMQCSNTQEQTQFLSIIICVANAALDTPDISL